MNGDGPPLLRPPCSGGRFAVNVLLYETGSGFGGSAVSLYRLVKCLDRERYTPHVVVHGVGPRIAEIQNAGVDVRRASLVYPFPQGTSGRVGRNVCFYGNFLVNTCTNAWRIARIIREKHIALVHLNNGIYEGFAALLAARLTGVPCMAHIRGTEPLTGLECRTGKWLSMIVTLNSHVENEYRSAFGSEKVCLIFNGVDLDAYEDVARGVLRAEYGLGQKGFLVGTIARLVPGKGISEFIEAASQVLKLLPDAKFVIVGNDPLGSDYPGDLKRRCRDLGIETNVIFTGWRNDVPSVLADLDVVAQVSTFPEGMSLTPIEAMALGKPVITSDVPGFTDTVVDGITGFIVPRGNITLLAERIVALATDPNRAQSMGAAARERVRDHFDVRMTVNKIERLYDRYASSREIRGGDPREQSRDQPDADKRDCSRACR